MIQDICIRYCSYTLLYIKISNTIVHFIIVLCKNTIFYLYYYSKISYIFLYYFYDYS
jgi:hypothetical protein